MLAVLKDQLAKRPGSPFFSRAAGGAEPRRRYLIATTGRTGSTFLCSRISDYACLGFPMEFLNEGYIGQFEAVFPNPSLQDFEAFVGANFCSEQGVFGLKSDWWRFRRAEELEALQSLVQPLDLIVYLYRQDFVAQAVSLALAVETQVWHSRDVADRSLEDLHGEVAFDAAAIKEHARNILNQEYYWQQYIKQSEVRCLSLSYEAVAGDVDAAVRSIARALDQKLGPAPPPSSVIERRRSAISLGWIDRFYDECDDFVDFWTEHRGLISAA
ncbi:MAG: Stf0 family sulfotransferase [Phenylobacterium sp.]